VRVKNTSIPLLDEFDYEIYIQDVGKLIEKVDDDHKKEMASKKAPEAFFDNYRRYSEIVNELKSLNAKYPALTKFYPSIGKSLDGRDIPAIAISALGFNNLTVQRIYFQGGQHSREWIGPATVMYQIFQLLENYGSDPLVTEFLNTLEFVIVPLVNPDGYEYSWTNDRLWRKNTRRNKDGSMGVDLNRNWNDHWGGSGSSGTPGSETYRGTAAFSEPETTVVSRFTESVDTFGNIMAAIDFHSYSQLILRPYGWTTANCPDNTALKIIGDGVSYEISRKSGKNYVSQRSIDLYITTGTASDWHYASGMWGAYTIELRDTGQYGFILPPAQIVPTGEEIWASMKYFIKIVRDTYPFSLNQ